jgi:hypothetical protein
MAKNGGSATDGGAVRTGEPATTAATEPATTAATDGESVRTGGATAGGGSAAVGASASGGRSSRRLRTTIRDMLLSMAVIVLPILLVIWLMPSNTPKTPVTVVSSADYQAMLTAARDDLPFKALSPTGLPAGWELTSDDYQPAGDTAADWHLGYQTASGKYAEFEQTTETIAQFLNEQGSDATQVSKVTVTGAAAGQWQEYTGSTPGGLRTLLFRQDGPSSLEIVAGSASPADLETLAASLRS